MSLKELLPRGLVDYFRVQSSRRRFPGNNIHTPFIRPSASIGKSCSFARDVEIGDNVQIGDYTYVNAGSIIASGVIGRFNSIGYRVQIGMAEHPTDFVSTSPRTYGSRNIFGHPVQWDDFQSPPNIGHDVWIGSSALILQGVTIGNGAIVAGGAVVTRNVAPFAIVAGSPARFIRYRLPEEAISLLSETEWWNHSEAELQSLKQLFVSNQDWLATLQDLTRKL